MEAGRRNFLVRASATGSIIGVSASPTGEAAPSGIVYDRTPSETAAAVVPVSLNYPPGDLRRYGANPTGATESDAAFKDAIAAGHRITADAAMSFLLSGAVGIASNTKMDLGGARLNFVGDTDGITTSSGSRVLYADVSNCTLNVMANNSHAAMNLVDVSRSTFRNIRIGRATPNTGWGHGIVLASKSSVCLWNSFYSIIADSVNRTFIYISGISNENRFYSAQLINLGGNGIDRFIPDGSAAVWLAGGTGNRFFGLELESELAATSDMVRFDYGANANTIIGLHTEAYRGSGSNRGINWNGGRGNTVIGHYALGYTNISVGTIMGNTWLDTTAIGKANSYIQGAALNVQTTTLTEPAVNPGGEKVNIGGTTSTSVGGPGGASSLPESPLGYLIINVGGKEAKIPYYNS